MTGKYILMPRKNILRQVPSFLFQDNYNTNDGWTQVSTLVTVDDASFPDICKANAATSGVDRRVHKSLGVTLSDTAWRAEFDFKSQSESTSGSLFSVISLAAGTANPHASSQDVVCVSNNWSGGPVLEIDYKDGAGAFTQSFPTIIAYTTNTQYYLRFERTSATNTKLSVFSDVNRTQHITGSPINFTIPSTITGLTHIHHHTSTLVGGARAFTMDLDNTTIYADLV